MLHLALHKLYSALFTVLGLPLLFIRLCYKSLNNPLHFYKITQRFGYYKGAKFKDSIWLHAVSLGESKAALPLIYALLKTYDYPIVITTMTLTGMQCITAEFANNPRVTHIYAPYDAGFVVKRFLNHIQPKICLLMETEIWPTMLYECKRQNIPIFILNARLSAKSTQGYQKYKLFFTAYLEKITMICAQSAQDLQNFLALGLDTTKVANIGNLKFDLQLPTNLNELTALLKLKLKNKFILVAASTHQGEEEIILSALKQLKNIANLVLIIVPRHPERFNNVEQLLIQQQWYYLRKTNITNNTSLEDIKIILGDTMGELLTYYALADVCFVGGSMVQVGGHNLLEPALLQKPIITGSYLANFVELSQKLLNSHGLMVLENKADFAPELANSITKLYTDHALREELAANAYHTMIANRGALMRTCALLENYLN